VSNTYAACLTPAGSGAIAVIAVRGSQAVAVVQASFEASGGRKPPEGQRPSEESSFSTGIKASGGREPPEGVLAPEGSLSHGGLTPPAGQIQLGTLAGDQVVLTMPRPDWVELHCHGGRAVVELLLETLAQDGVTVCTWQELERRTNPDRAVALIALTEALTVRTAAILLHRLHDPAVGGGFLGPWRVVVAGAPNVGKSSLVNALAGYQRSIVSPLPGTTRDVVSAMLAIDGWPIELIDTAGLHGTGDSLEAAGIHLAEQAAATAHLCLWVLDGAGEPVWPSLQIENLLVVINKTDLPPGWDYSMSTDALRVSAQTGEGLETLCQAIAARVTPPDIPHAGLAGSSP